MHFNFGIFVPGQRVKFISKYNPEIKCGETGTVVPHPYRAATGATGGIAVDWDKEDTNRHDCAGNARKHHGWCVSKRDVEIIF